MKIIIGGITSPIGYRAASAKAGIKKDNKSDMALVVSDVLANCAGVFTKNVVKGHCLKLSMKHIENGTARAFVVNSGNANACVGSQGDVDALKFASLTSNLIGCEPSDIMPASTGVIGHLLPMEKIEYGINEAFTNLSYIGSSDAAEAIMTTDLVKKEYAVEIIIDGKAVRIGGIAKGSGMIHPNMATMIGLITTDAKIDSTLLYDMLLKSCNKSFNRISVDGDTSVCDMVCLMANGMSGVTIDANNMEKFIDALISVCEYLAKKVARDGEGATKLIEINIKNAKDIDSAHTILNSIAKSPLVKTAIYGNDANWGRILTAAGYSGIDFDPDKVDVYIGDICTCKNGIALQFDEYKAKVLLQKDTVILTVDLNSGNINDRIWTCDFTYDYIKINASYRS